MPNTIDASKTNIEQYNDGYYKYDDGYTCPYLRTSPPLSTSPYRVAYDKMAIDTIYDNGTTYDRAAISTWDVNTTSTRNINTVSWDPHYFLRNQEISDGLKIIHAEQDKNIIDKVNKQTKSDLDNLIKLIKAKNKNINPIFQLEI